MNIPNFIEIGQTCCGWTYVRTDVPTDGRTFPPLMLLGRLGKVDLKSTRYTYTGWPQKICTIFCKPSHLPNINRFSELFHRQNHDRICNNIITKDPTTPQVCRYTTLQNVMS